MRRLVLAIHDQSFPSTPEEDVGRGSPYGKGARDLLSFVGGVGFDGIQLGPQGDTALDNPSPYDGALFAKSPLSIALATLAEAPDWSPLCEGLLAPLVEGRPPGPENRARYRYAWGAARTSLASLHARFSAEHRLNPRYRELAARFEKFQRLHEETLRRDGSFDALVEEHGTDDWRRWPERDRTPSGSLSRVPQSVPATSASTARAIAIERHAFGQFILAEQHRGLRQTLAAAPESMVLFGDLPIGFSHRDVWSLRPMFRSDYVMGAPPSRTNPSGQPWGFPVLDPDQYFGDAARRTPGPVLELLIRRVDAILAGFDGLRIDHPHGLVCPWVYPAGDPDPAAAVGRGARLFCSPNLRDHPDLARLAIPTVEQLSADPGIARYADDWVHQLRDDQVARYGVLFDAVMARVAKAGWNVTDVVCEVLSTWPHPLRRVMERYGLGRFCVLQKADLTRPGDVYRAENAAARDWIMVGNHDTRPIWLLAETWQGTVAGAQWASYLAECLTPARFGRARLARWLAADARHLCQAMFAVLFASRAHQVSVFFADFFGLRETYNRPGIVDDENWTLRLPTDWKATHHERVKRLEALNMPLVLSLALAAQGGASHRELVDGLLREAYAQTPTLDGEIVAFVRQAAGRSMT